MDISRIRIAFVALVSLVSLVVGGCAGDSREQCGPANCEGCCGPSGKCFSGTESANCGVGGQSCESCGENACVDGTCSPTCGVCIPDRVEKKDCGNCGVRERSCNKECAWGSWSLCSGEGLCSPAAAEDQACGSCGTQTRICTDECSWGAWGACQEGVCSPDSSDSRACGSCGTQSRVCSSTCSWGEWGACGGEHGCAPDSTESQACGNCQSQTRVCSSECSWGDWGACNGPPICEALKTESRFCGDCGTQNRVCSEACAWGDWTVCAESIAWRNHRAGGTNYSIEVRLQGQKIWVGTTGGLVRSVDRGLTWKAFNADDGLGADEVTALAMDGAMVLAGTAGGGLSYSSDDGVTWKSVTTSTGLAGDTITALLVASDRTFWVGTNTGLSHGSSLAGPWVNFGVAQGLSADRVEDIAEGPDGSIWIAHTSLSAPGISVTADGGTTWAHPDVPDALGPNNDNATQTVFFDSQGILWVSTWADGLYRSPDKGSTWTWFGSSVYGETSNSFVDDYFESPAGTIWMATQGQYGSGVSITQDSGASWIKRTNLCAASVFSLAGDDLGRMYAAARGCGLSWTDNLGESWTRVSLNVGLPANVLTAVSRGPANSIWVGTFENGASYSKDGGENWTNASWASAGSGSNSVQFILFDEKAVPPTLWIATLAGLFRSKDGGLTFEAKTSENGLGADDVRSVAVDRSSGKEIIWAAVGTGLDDSPGGVSKSVDGGDSWVNFTRDETNYGSNNSTDVFVDHTGTVWVATNSGLRRSADKGATWETWIYKLNSSIPTWYLTSVWVEPDGTIWIAGHRADDATPMAAAKSVDGGLNWTKFNSSTGLSVDDYGTRLYRDPKAGTMYLGTESGGAFWTKGQGASWCHVGAGGGLRSNWVTGIVVDDSGAILLSTRNGLAIGSVK